MFVVIGINERRYSIHTTLLGVFTTRELAEQEVIKERGGFEDIEIIEADIDEPVRRDGPSIYSTSPVW